MLSANVFACPTITQYSIVVVRHPFLLLWSQSHVFKALFQHFVFFEESVFRCYPRKCQAKDLCSSICFLPNFSPASLDHGCNSNIPWQMHSQFQEGHLVKCKTIRYERATWRWVRRSSWLSKWPPPEGHPPALPTLMLLRK